MCGIGGILKPGLFTHEDASASHALLMSLTRRGIDAWGFFDGNSVYKEPGNYAFSPNREIIMNLVGRTSIFLCHTRAATQGDPLNNNNNHPLELYPFVMAHNGVIFRSDPYDKPEDIEVDSYDLLYWIWYEYEKTKNTVKAIKQGVKHVDGSYAVWLYNRDEGETYVFRNNKPLVAIVLNIERDITVFASDELAIKDSVVKYREVSVHSLDRRLLEIAPNTIYRITPGKLEVVGKLHRLS